MTIASCFSRDELRSYLLGDLPEAASDQVASHVEECVACEATVIELDGDSDTLMESLREPVVQEEPPSAYRLAAKRSMSYWRESIAESAANDSGDSASELPHIRDYELLQQLARGGMGTVYRARHLRLNRQVALKVLPPRWLKNPAVVARFEREMQAVGSLRHESIVQATDGGEAEGVHFLVMELIDGLDGGALVQNLNPLPVADACEIARQTAVGMAYVHQQGIIHRDLKPSNLMVTRAGDVKVLDLGLARVVGEQMAGDELTTVGQLMGTLDFMAPEQLENSHEVDERTDIYSLGATLYKLLTGRSPHASNESEPLLSKIRRIASDPTIPLRKHRPDAPPELCDLVDSMLSHQANGRPASMEAVSDALAEFSESSDLAKRIKEATKIQKQRTQAERSADPSRFESFSAWEGAALASQGELSRPERGRRFLTLTATGLLLAAVAMGVVITLQTMAGQLIIETASPGVEVRVLKAGHLHRQLTLNQKANSLRLGAGAYEIEIISDADGLQIENGSYTLKRGETWLAKIVHQSVDNNNSLAADTPPSVRNENLHAVSTEPTYEGKTLQQWLGLLRKERSPQQFHEACGALEKLATGEDAADAVSSLLVAARFHGSTTYYRDENSRPISLWDTGHKFLAGCDQSVVVDAFADELEHAENANVAFILEYLTDSADNVRPAASERLLTQVERIAGTHRSEYRMRALQALQGIGPEDVSTRLLLSALGAPEIEVRLFAAEILIEMDSNASLVVSMLRQVLRSGELRHRAEAGWLLGHLSAAAAPAFPELIAAVEDDDYQAAAEAVYSGWHRGSGGSHSRLGISVKDAAIRALAEIGNKAATPALIAEWEHRLRSGSRPSKSVPAWMRDRPMDKANTYNTAWVADAIERLTGMRPMNVKRRSDLASTTVWYIADLSFERAYRAGLGNRRGDIATEAVETATQLLPFTQEDGRAQALTYIENVGRTPGPAELDQELKLIELLATVEPPQSILQAIFVRWSRYTEIEIDEWKPGEQAAAIEAYHDLAIRIIRDTTDWQTTLPPFLIQQIHDERPPAAIVFMDLIEEFDAQSQVAGMVSIVEFVARFGTGHLGKSMDALAAWFDNESHRASILQISEERTGAEFENLVVGLLRSGLADETVREKLRERFADESIIRQQILGKLIDAFGDPPNLPQVVIDLIQHPALDAPVRVVLQNDGVSKQISLRADKYLPILKHLPPQHRIEFIPFLKELVETGKDGDSEAARQVLRSW